MSAARGCEWPHPRSGALIILSSLSSTAGPQVTDSEWLIASALMEPLQLVWGRSVELKQSWVFFFFLSFFLLLKSTTQILTVVISPLSGERHLLASAPCCSGGKIWPRATQTSSSSARRVINPGTNKRAELRLSSPPLRCSVHRSVRVRTL